MKKIFFLTLVAFMWFSYGCISSKKTLVEYGLKDMDYPYTYRDTSNSNIYTLNVFKYPGPDSIPKSKRYYSIMSYYNDVKFSYLDINLLGTFSSIDFPDVHFPDSSKIISMIKSDDKGNIEYIMSYKDKYLDGYVFRFDEKKLCAIYFYVDEKFKKYIFLRSDKYKIKSDFVPFYLK